MKALLITQEVGTSGIDSINLSDGNWDQYRLLIDSGRKSFIAWVHEGIRPLWTLLIGPPLSSAYLFQPHSQVRFFFC